jgi:hypothetical protein
MTADFRDITVKEFTNYHHISFISVKYSYTYTAVMLDLISIT